MKKKLLSVFVCVALVATIVAGCGKKDTQTSGGTGKYSKFITVDVFDGLANYQGIQSGWFAKIVKDKFNMELNIIAPNVAGGGDTLFQTRSTAGDLGDLIIYGADDGKLQNMVTAGLVLDLTDMLKDKAIVTKYKNAIDSLNSLVKEDGIWGIPSSVSEQPATNPSEGLDPTFGPYLRWDRVLKLYFNANQMGLVDPESTTQNYDTMYAKYQDGQILYSPWPWLGQAAYNTPTNKEEGKGFMISSIADMKDLSYGCRPNGDRQTIAIGTKAEDPERLADFIDWLYSPEGIQMSAAQTSSSSGPEGLTWEMKNNRPELTEFGWKAFYEGGDTLVPEEWGGGLWKDGVSALNFPAVIPSDINPKTNFPYNYTLWESVLEKNTTPLDTDWQTQMDAKTTIEFLQKNDQLMVAPGASYIAPEEDSEITTLRGQCKSIIIENSWKAVFASNENEFNNLIKEMQDTVIGLGYDKVLAVDMQNAKDQNTTREQAVAASK